MAKKYISDFTGGLNDVTRPDLLADNQVQECINYEITGTGNLVKRKDTEIFDEQLDTTLDELFGLSNGGILLSISEPYYPSLTLKNQANDYMLFIFGQDSSGNKLLFALYEQDVENPSDNPWTYQYTDLNGTTKDLLTSYKSIKASFSTDFLNFDVGGDKANFTNGAEPNGFFYVDNKQEAVSGTLGFDPPLNVPIIKSLRDDQSTSNLPVFNLNNFTRSEDVETITDPGYVQMVYTYVTKDGFESNPSPISAAADYAYFYKDSDRNNIQKINNLEVSNLSLPSTMSPEYVDRVEYFNVYIRVFKSLKVDASKNFEFCQQVPVLSKNRWGSNTDNTYLIERPLEPGNTASYENDAAPRSKFVSTTGGVTFLGNTKNSLGFPGADFKFKAPINIYNSNLKTYIDAPIQIRVWDTDSNPQNNGDGNTSKKVTSLKWLPFFTMNQSDNSDNLRSDYSMSEFAKEHIRLYHQDMTTPLKVVFRRGTLVDASNKYVDLMVKIPQLPPGSTTLYLAFNNIEGGSPSNNGCLYPKRIDTLTEVKEILQYFTSDNENYTFFQEIEQALINNNIEDSQLAEMARLLYSHPYLTTLNSNWPSIEDVDPLYKQGRWVAGTTVNNTATPAMQDMTVKEHVWGDSTLVSCSTNQMLIDTNIVNEESEMGFVNQAYMNYGGYVRKDPHDDYTFFNYTEPFSTDFIPYEETLNTLHLLKDTAQGRVIARDYENGSFWSSFKNYDNDPGGAKPNSRVTTSALTFERPNNYPNTILGNVAFGGIGFNNEDLANQATEFTVFFHMQIPQGETLKNEKNASSTTSTWRNWMRNAYIGTDWANYGYYNDEFKTAGFYGGGWKQWRNIFSIRCAIESDLVQDDGSPADNCTVTPRFNFGMTLGKKIYADNNGDTSSDYHHFLSMYHPSTMTSDSFRNQYLPRTNEYIERQAHKAFAAEDTASWLDEYPMLWCLFIGQKGDPTWRLSNYANYSASGSENPWTPFYNNMRWNSFICYTGNSNDLHGPITSGQPMNKQVMPQAWDRPANYYIALSFKDGVDGLEKAKTSLFVCNTGGTEPFDENNYNILDSTYNRIYTPTDAKQVTDIVGKDLNAESFLRNIIGKDGFNFGSAVGFTNMVSNDDFSNRDGHTSNMRKKMQDWHTAKYYPKDVKFSEIHIEYGNYFNGNSVEHKTAFNYSAFGFHMMKEGVGWVPPRRSEDIASIHNKNITFGDTFEDETVLNNRTVRWSDMGGAHYPDLNYKFVKEPIEALMPAPGFLQDAYQNCMLVFTRNMIYRFILEGSDDGSWAAKSDNLIEEYNQFGLYAPKSLVKAGNALFWLSESGIVQFDGKGLRLIDKNKVKLDINQDAVGFFNPISNQYVLTNV